MDRTVRGVRFVVGAQRVGAAERGALDGSVQDRAELGHLTEVHEAAKRAFGIGRGGTTLRHKLLSDELPEGDFDLVHARLVLAWLPEPSRALAKLIAALKPGGWLVMEELDCISTDAAVNVDPTLSATLGRVFKALERQLHRRGRFDSGFARRLYGVLESAGLVRVHAEGRVGVWPGGSAGARLWRLTLEWLREPMANSGVASLEEIDRVIA